MNPQQFEQLLAVCGRLLLLARMTRKGGAMPTVGETREAFAVIEHQCRRIRGNRQTPAPTWDDARLLLEWVAGAALEILQEGKS